MLLVPNRTTTNESSIEIPDFVTLSIKGRKFRYDFSKEDIK